MSFWQGKNAIVTGAGSGFGRLLAQALAARGVAVWLSDIDAAAAEHAAETLGPQARARALDVRDAAAMRRLVDEVVRAHGRIDLLFNNAGIGMAGEMRDLGVEHFDRIIDINIRGVMNGIAAAYPRMVEQGGGTIVNTASVAGLVPMPLFTPYSMSKHAVVGLSTSLRIEAAFHNIRVCVLCPAGLKTPMLKKPIPADLPGAWRPDSGRMQTKLGCPPYSAKKFVRFALRGIEKNRGVIVAPLRARIGTLLYGWAPGIAVARMRKAVAEERARR